uniref:Uncharacterized protein n=2 Tax=Magallana gigas TaxID=29159 RepID=A0A8W8NDE1_MAGGI
MEFLMLWCLLVLIDTAVVNGSEGSTLNPSYETTTEDLIGIIEEATFSTDSVTFASITDRSFTTDPIQNTDNDEHSEETTFSTDSVTFASITDKSFTTDPIQNTDTGEHSEETTFSTDSVTFASITDRPFTTDPIQNTDNEEHSEETTFSTDSVTFGPSTDRSFTTGSVEKPTTAEPDGDPEFVSMGSLNLASVDVDYHCSNYGSNYRALFLYNITEDLVHVHKFLNRSYYGVEFWTDLVIISSTAMSSNVTGNLFPKESLISENGHGNCVTMKGESGRIFQKAKGCDSRYYVMCRIYTPNTGGGDSSSPDCICNCKNGVSHPTLTEDEVEIVVSEIRKNLTVFKANLSSNIRKRISASDPRLSSRVIGMTLGVSILSFVASLLVIPDLVAGFRCLMSWL